MVYAKIQPCPTCLDGGDPVVMTYEHGWRHVECLDCDRLGPGEGSKLVAIQSWNRDVGIRINALATTAQPEGSSE